MLNCQKYKTSSDSRVHAIRIHFGKSYKKDFVVFFTSVLVALVRY
jgi:hypothetical protein